ncbi:MAG: general secretion pathway protein GspB [Desulfosarcina sp.]
MSSILEALKKAERESAADRGRATPWSAPLPEPSPYRPHRRIRWLPVGAAAVLAAAVCAVVFWQVRYADSPQPSPPTPATPPISSRDRAPFSAANRPATSQQMPSETASAGSVSQRAPVESEPSKATATDPQAAQTAVQRASAPSQSAPPPAAQPPPRPEAERQAVTTTTPTPAAAEGPFRQPEPSPQPAQKNYRSDPRIELQALVWAPQAADRFVVINNRLIKEGGSIDAITVVEIMRDDVLLSEGTDRWYEQFKIR